MVNIQAASENSADVNCLSRCPPPGRFFADLGAKVDKIEHVSIDFLDTTEEITKGPQSTIAHVYALLGTSVC